MAKSWRLSTKRTLIVPNSKFFVLPRNSPTCSIGLDIFGRALFIVFFIALNSLRSIVQRQVF
jgi:hypothetical protein